MMTYKDAVEVIQRERGDAVAVVTMTQTKYWNRTSAHPELDIGISNGMSKASSVGLGIAIGAPERNVYVLDGDGSLLMNLGSLVTVATQAPANFFHFLFQNNVYAVTGGQPVPGVGKADFQKLAEGSGYRHTRSYDDIESFATDFPELSKLEGPVMIVLAVETEIQQGGVEQTWESNARMPAALRSVRKSLDSTYIPE
ncbi:MAG: thiamine pyrophosphate-binding protein [Chloroflexi bacterium]|nr:thiamine pyrophosphate-binding protein [Chloroflexota bacterium]